MNTLSKGKPLQQPFLGCHPPLPHPHGRQALSLHQHLLDAARCTSFVRFFSSKWRVTTRALRPSQRCQPDGIRLKIGEKFCEKLQRMEIHSCCKGYVSTEFRPKLVSCFLVESISQKTQDIRIQTIRDLSVLPKTTPVWSKVMVPWSYQVQSFGDVKRS